MSRASRTDNSDAVSLFPFLAVLLCTMGSLIVILVVLSRQARLQAASAAHTTSPKVSKEIAEQIAQLEKLREQLADRLQDDRLRLQHWEDHLRRLSERLVQLQAQAQQLVAIKRQQVVDREQAELEEARLREMVQRMRDEIQHARDEASKRPKSYAVIPYQGKNKTYRRPLYIECRADAVVLQPEGIRLSSKDFENIDSPNNPLAAALRAASEYYAQADNSSVTSESKDRSVPYPFLLVRPQGISAYYRARTAIESWGDQFGYELIEQNWKLDFPLPNPQLAALQRRAIEESRAMRAHLARHTFGPQGRYEVNRTDSKQGQVPITHAIAGNQHPRSKAAQEPNSQSSDSQDASTAGNEHLDSYDDAQHSLAIARGHNWALPQGAQLRGVTVSRPVHILCHANRFVVLGQPPGAKSLAIRASDQADADQDVELSGPIIDVVDELVATVWDRIDTWGTAGRGLRWQPQLILHVASDGQQRADGLRRLLRKSGLEFGENREYQP